MIRYDELAAEIESTGMVARGGFEPGPDDGVPRFDDDRPTVAVVVVGNIGGAMWPSFRAARPIGAAGSADPLDDWTRAVLGPVADRFGARFLHPSDEPFIPMQRWARRADDVFESPIGLLIHPDHGLWHAYRGVLLFADPVVGLPAVGGRRSPCDSCTDRPCLSTCPVDAFSHGDDRGRVHYDHERCRSHVRSGDEPVCATAGCAARLACPIGADRRYGVDQMAFHMRAFVGGDG